MTAFVDRLLDKFTVGDGCWEWQGAKSSGGYGQLQRGKRGAGLAVTHRAMYELFIGDIPEGLQLDHLCRNRSCGRPSHLEPVTAAVNTQRADHSGWSAVRKAMTECKRGHEFTFANTARQKNGARLCRKCDALRGRKLVWASR